MRLLIATCGLALLAVLLLGNEGASQQNPVSGIRDVPARDAAGVPIPAVEEAVEDSLRVLETLLLEDDTVTDYVALNSSLRMSTPGIRKVVRTGDKALAPLIRILKCDGLSFHTFCLATMACQAILRTHDEHFDVRWRGRVTFVEEKGSSRKRIAPGENGDLTAFRKKIVGRLEDKIKELELRAPPQ